MKRIHESVDYVKHRDSKLLVPASADEGNTVFDEDELLEHIAEVHILGYKIMQDKNSKFVVYLVRVVSGAVIWEVRRRYNDFLSLNETLAANSEIQASLPILPPKKVFGGFNEDFLQQRKKDLNDYLNKLILIPSVKSVDCVKLFFWKSKKYVGNGGFYSKNQYHSNLTGGFPIPSTKSNGNTNSNEEMDDSNESEDVGSVSDDDYSPLHTPRGSADGYGSRNSLSSMNKESDKSGAESNDEDEEVNEQEGSYRPCIDDFEMVRVIGKGSFGKVLLCKKKDTGKLYAIKVLKKQHVIRRKQVAHTKTERSVLGMVDHPYVVKLHYAFQTGDKLHFVLDFCSGGELFFHLGRAGRFNEKLGMFYSAEIALALGHLHTKGIVYRDLKPENILLDAEGHIKLADFGLSKEGILSGIKGTHSFCGTPEYLAPEVLNRTGHGTSVDWWSLGALLYEMLTGLPPWYSQDRQKMFASIRGSPLRFPDYISQSAMKILSQLLERDVTLRLGSNRDVEEIKEHDFFASVDWVALFERRIPSPFVPRLNHLTDTANFDQQFTRMSINSMDLSRSPVQSSVVSDGPLFDGFTFINQSNILETMAKVKIDQSEPNSPRSGEIFPVPTPPHQVFPSHDQAHSPSGHMNNFFE